MALHSSVAEINSGVPQGSILGPILFLLYVNDLSQFIESKNVVLYVDDVNVLVTGNTHQEAENNLKSMIARLMEWASINNLNINVDKSKILYFHLSHQPLTFPPIIVNSLCLEYTSKSKFLVNFSTCYAHL